MQRIKNWGDPVKMGLLQLSSRVVMSALTRTRCDPRDGIPTDLHVQYYTQRSGAGMIFTQASAWSQRGHGYPGAANFYTKEQVEGWKKVVNAVHKKNGRLFLQLYHAGRATHPKINGGLQVWGPSSIAIRDIIHGLNQPYPVPKEMTISEIKESQQEFRKAIKNAREIGFDGIQIHGANGYLVDQFLKSETNKRSDEYGGSAEKRGRYSLQLVDACLQHFKPHQVGIKLSPVSQFGDMYDQNPVQTYSYLLKQLSKKKIGFIQLRQSSEYGATKKGSGAKTYYEKTPPEQIEHVCKTLRPYFNGIVIANDAMTYERGLQFIRDGWADMISFGRLYISNPDLAERLIKNKQLNHKWDFHTFFSPLNPKGYIDYPFYDQWKKQQGQSDTKSK